MKKHLTDNEIQSCLHSLTAEERTRIEDHLNDCADCRKRLLLYKKLGDAVASASTDPIPEGFETAVMERLRGVRRLRRVTDVIVTAVALTGLILIGLIVFLTPQLRHMVAGYLMDAWQFGNEFVAVTEGSSEATAILALAGVLLILFAVIDRLAIGRLRLAIGRGKYPRAN
jgi:anti-sigma factor RsiW